MIKKVLIGILIVSISFLLSLFILPSEIQLIRFIEVSAHPDQVWGQISTIQSWGNWSEGKVEGKTIEWQEGISLEITEVDLKRLKISYIISEYEGKGNIIMDLSPEAMDDNSDNDKVNLRWEHKYNVGYNPFDRLQHWLLKGQLALEVDDRLERLKDIAEQETKKQ